MGKKRKKNISKCILLKFLPRVQIVSVSHKYRRELPIQGAVVQNLTKLLTNVTLKFLS